MPPGTPPPPVEPVHTVGKNLYLGIAAGSYGQFNIDAGSLTVGGSIRVGNEGEGQFNQTDGLVTVKGDDPDPLENEVLRSASDGAYNQRRMKGSGPSLQCHSTGRYPGLIVGLNNFGEYNLTRGTLKVNFSEIIGLGEGSDGSRFIQNYGTHKIAGNLYVARVHRYEGIQLLQSDRKQYL